MKTVISRQPLPAQGQQRSSFPLPRTSLVWGKSQGEYERANEDIEKRKVRETNCLGLNQLWKGKIKDDHAYN